MEASSIPSPDQADIQHTQDIDKQSKQLLLLYICRFLYCRLVPRYFGGCLQSLSVHKL